MLTPRESECLKMTALGLTDARTAQALNIARGTVRFHLRNTCRKLGVANRSAAIYRAAKFDLI